MSPMAGAGPSGRAEPSAVVSSCKGGDRDTVRSMYAGLVVTATRC
jgi:hypothetical protein